MMLSVDKIINPRNIVNILNIIEYDIHSFVISGQYVNRNTCKFIIRNMNNPFGWDYDLKVSIDKKELNLGKSETNYKELLLQDDTILFIPNNNQYEQKIPKIIFQTSEQNLFNQLHYNTIMSFVDLNPEYKYLYFDSNDRRNFIIKNFDKEVLDAYDILIPGAYQSDLFRLCFLYKNGGCYFDCKNICKLPLNQLILPNETELICMDWVDNFNCNGIMISESNNYFLKQCIDKIIYNCKYKAFGKNSTDVTGPCILTNYTKHITPRFKNNFHRHGDLKSNFLDRKTNQIIALPCYKNYYQEYQKNYNQEYYDELWNKKEIFYDKLFEDEEFILFGFSKHKIRNKNIILKNKKYLINLEYFDVKVKAINKIKNNSQKVNLKSRMIVKIEDI